MRKATEKVSSRTIQKKQSKTSSKSGRTKATGKERAVAKKRKSNPRPSDWPGLKWRVLARQWEHPDRAVLDIGGDGSSWFDELVVGNWLHLEWMHGRTWWLRLGDASIYVTVPKGKTPPIIQIQRGAYYECPTAELDEANLAKVDPEDDPYGPLEKQLRTLKSKSESKK